MPIVSRSELDRQTASLAREIKRTNGLMRQTRTQCVTLSRTIERGANSFSMIERLRRSKEKLKQLQGRLRNLINARQVVTLQLITRRKPRDRIVIPFGDDGETIENID